MTSPGSQIAPHDVSVLMSTYAGETAVNLAESLGSVLAQTRKPDQVVLVVDGPIDAAQEAVIADAVASDGIDVVRRPKAGGLGRALNEGLKACRCAFVMRMDSDDVCTPDRLALQMAFLARRPDVDLVGAWAEEFYADGHATALKASPCGHEYVAQALRWRNVLVHPSIVVRASALRAVGGYRSRFGLLEDYDLFVRLLMAGALIHVIPKILIRVRTSLAQKSRRGGLSYVRNEIAFRRECLRVGFVTTKQFVVITGLYTIFRLISGAARRRLYDLVRT